MTDFVPIIKQLEEEAEKFNQAAKIIRDLQSQSSNGGTTRAAAAPKARTKPRFSAAARKKMSEAQRARWAKIKNIAAAKPAAKAA